MLQGTSSKGFNSSKTSRITLIDLAGLNKNKIEDGDTLVDALTGKTAEVINKGSCLTRLLQKSLCGNVKASVICSISTDNKYLLFQSQVHENTCALPFVKMKIVLIVLQE